MSDWLKRNASHLPDMPRGQRSEAAEKMKLDRIEYDAWRKWMQRIIDKQYGAWLKRNRIASR